MRVAFAGGGTFTPRIVRRKPGDDPLVIRGGLVLDPSGTLERLDLLIESLRFEALAPSIDTPGRVIDATGLLVLPGLVHPWFEFASNEKPSSFAMAKQLRAAVYFGITTVHLPSISETRGRALRQAIAEGIFDGPRILLSKSVGDKDSIESPLTSLRRSIGFGVDLVLTDSHAPELDKIARSVAEMARRPLLKESDLHTASARSSYQLESLRYQPSSNQRYTSVAEESMASARTLGIDESIGSIEVGKLADATIVEADDNAWRPVMVLTTSNA